MIRWNITLMKFYYPEININYKKLRNIIFNKTNIIITA